MYSVFIKGFLQKMLIFSQFNFPAKRVNNNVTLFMLVLICNNVNEFWEMYSLPYNKKQNENLFGITVLFNLFTR